MPIYGKSDNLFDTEFVDLKTISSSGIKSLIYSISPANFKFDGGVIEASKHPFNGSGLKILASAAGEKLSDNEETAGSLTIELYHSETTDGTTALTSKLATYGPFATKDIEFSDDFLSVAIPDNSFANIQVVLKGSAFKSGKVWIRIGA